MADRNQIEAILQNSRKVDYVDVLNADNPKEKKLLYS